MLRHYFKLAGRVLIKNKYYSFINMFGLVFGMVSALMIAKYIGGSLVYDNFHSNKESIYSVTQEEFVNGESQRKGNSTYSGVGELLSQFPEVINYSRYAYHVGSQISANDESGSRISFFENKIFAVDSGFLKILTFPLRHGYKESALSKPNSIVLTSSTSRRYFGDMNPVGEVVTIRVPWGQETEYEVTGVAEDLPGRSQFKFDFLITRSKPDPAEFWIVPDCSIFLLLKDQTNSNELAGKLTTRVNEVPRLKEVSRKVRISLDSMSTVTLSDTEYLLIALGIFIIIISWVNYINQVIAQSYWRMKEIGILRIMGATHSNLKKQFIIESGLICLGSMLIVGIIYRLIEPFLSTFTGGHILPLFGDPTMINNLFLIIFCLGTILAASIPAIILFSADFGKTLRSGNSKPIGSVGLRHALVVLQFSISTILLISIFVISDQLEYMEDKDKGIVLDDVLIVQAPIVAGATWDEKRKSVELFKQRCDELPFILRTASSTTVPGEEYRQETYLSLQGNTTRTMVHQNGVDDQFFDLYDVEFKAGQNFIHEADWKNRNSIILNESAAKALGIVDFEQMIKILDHESNELYDLVGIVRDYHQTSLKYRMRPIAFKFNIVRGHFSLKIDEEKFDEKDNLSAINKFWEQTYPDASFDYYYLTEKFASQDKEERYFGQLFNYFTILSIIISCLGLLGLSLLISTKRQREIGVRKVFGASSLNILLTFLKGYLAPLSIALLTGTPLAIFLVNRWLENFAYRVEIGIGLVTFAWLWLIVIFLFTVAYHTIKSSLENPVRILRD